MATTFSVGRSRREPPTMGKQLVNLITCGCESSHFCNLPSRPRTHAVLVINLYELLGNPTTLLIEPPELHFYPLEEADSPIHVVPLYPHVLRRIVKWVYIIPYLYFLVLTDDRIENNIHLKYPHWVYFLKYVRDEPVKKYIFDVNTYLLIHLSIDLTYQPEVRIRVFVFDATFNNISITSWRSGLLVEESGVPGEN